jgi:hypothetical protein
MRVVRSPLAMQRVNQHAAHIAGDRPVAGEEWVEGLFASEERLKALTFSDREVEALPRSEGEVVLGRYRIMHRIAAERVIILTGRHQRHLLDGSEAEDSE